MIRTIRTMVSILFKICEAVKISLTHFFVFASGLISGKVVDNRPDRPDVSFSLFNSSAYGRMMGQIIILTRRMIRMMAGRSSSCDKSLSCNGFQQFRTIRTIIRNLSPRMCACACARACVRVRTCGKVGVYRPDHPAPQLIFQFQ